MNWHAYILFWVALLAWFIHDVAYGDFNDDFIDFVVCAREGKQTPMPHPMAGEVIFMRKTAIVGVGKEKHRFIKEDGTEAEKTADDCATISFTNGRKVFVVGTVEEVLTRLGKEGTDEKDVEGDGYSKRGDDGTNERKRGDDGDND